MFAVLLAISPLLVIYSRLARPYAITLLLGWIAHGAFVRYHASPRGQARAGLVYGTATTLALWLHPIVGPFVLAPLLWAALQLRQPAGAADRRQRLLRLACVALPTSLAIAVLLLPPMVAHPESLLGKSGVDAPNLGTLVGVWYAWLGTGYTSALVICLALAAYGAGEIWRALPEAHTGALGIALTLLAVMLTRPAWSANPATLARYLLPFLPLLLLAVAAGAIRAARRIATPGTGARRVLAAGMAALPCAALAFESPLAPMLQYPSTQTLGLVYYMDFRPAKNPFLPYTRCHPAVAVLAKPCRAARGKHTYRRGTVLFRKLQLGRGTMGARKSSARATRLSYGAVRRPARRRGAGKPPVRLPQCGASRR